MATPEPQTAQKAEAPGTLDEMMLAMDVVDTLRHREGLVERELNEDVREEQLVARLRELYKSQGIEVPDRIIKEGVKGLKESRFVYTPSPPGFARTMALIWVRRGLYARRIGTAAAIIALVFGAYQYTVVRPARQAAEAARVELVQTLPRDLEALHQAIVTEAKFPLRPPTTPRSWMSTPSPTRASILAPVWLLPRLWNSPKIVACVSVALRLTFTSPVADV